MSYIEMQSQLKKSYILGKWRGLFEQLGVTTLRTEEEVLDLLQSQDGLELILNEMHEGKRLAVQRAVASYKDTQERKIFPILNTEVRA